MPARNAHQKIKKNLYLIALIPHPELREQIKSLKEEMKLKFGAKHALKSPAHITLQMPFKRNAKEEDQITELLAAFVQDQHPFAVRLSGFDCFPPRVIFVKIEDHRPVAELHAALRQVLIDQLGFDRKEANQAFHPHMTIAARDLKKSAFREAWKSFADRSFQSSFEVKSLFLLKHNGKFWDIYREFEFG